jgi:hypothetical protein
MSSMKRIVMPSIDSLAEPIASAGRKAAGLPYALQAPILFLLSPVWPAVWLQAMTNIIAIGVFIPFLAVGKLTGSVRLGIVGAIAWHAFTYAFIAFGMGWMEGIDQRRAPAAIHFVPFIWVVALIAVFLAWMLWPLL